MKRKHTAALFALLAAALYAIHIPFSKLLLDIAAPILLMLGAAKTSAYNAIAPFLGVGFGMLLGERPGLRFYVGLGGWSSPRC